MNRRELRADVLAGSVADVVERISVTSSSRSWLISASASRANTPILGRAVDAGLLALLAFAEVVAVDDAAVELADSESSWLQNCKRHRRCSLPPVTSCIGSMTIATHRYLAACRITFAEAGSAGAERSRKSSEWKRARLVLPYLGAVELLQAPRSGSHA